MTDSPPLLTELDKFKSLLFLVLSSGDQFITCPDERKAREIRRRFYTLRSSLPPTERDIAERIVFSLVGRRIRCSKNSRTDWTQSVTIGAADNDTSNSRVTPTSD